MTRIRLANLTSHFYSVAGIGAILAGAVILASAAMAQSPGEKGFVYGGRSGATPASNVSWRNQGRLEFDLGAIMPDAKFRAANAPGTRDNDWKGDGLDDDPAQALVGIRASFASGDRSSWGLMWQGMALSSYPSTSTRNVTSGASTIPAGSDLDVMIQVHSLSAWWRRDWVVNRWGGVGAGSWYSMLGLNYDIVSMTIDSDSFPVTQSKHRMAQMLPMPMLGLGIEVQGKSNVFRLEGRVAYLPEVTTLQKVRGADVKQSSTSYELSAMYEFGLADWCGLGFTARWISMTHELSATTLDQSLDINGPAASVRFSFRF